MRQMARVPRLLFATLFILLLQAVVLPVMAQEQTPPVTDDDVNAVAKELYCPICESTPLDVCATQACADWREVIRTKLSEGQSAQEIKDYFELQYGPQALAEPPRSGFTLAVWILPVVAVVIGLFFFSRYVRGLRASAGSAEVAVETSPVETASEEDDYRTRIESELREM